MDAIAVVLQAPEQLELSRLAIEMPGAADIVVEVHYSGISTGTERLLYTGRMPPFPGMGYPLVPGYESVGVVREAGPEATLAVGETVFVPGARCFGAVRGLFGGAASRLVVASNRAVAVPASLNDQGALLALAATGYHAVAIGVPDLVIGHGVLGRLIARLAVQAGGAPTVWETNPARAQGATGYKVVAPDDDTRRDYKCICDVSGDANILDSLISRCGHGATIILAGFYADRLSFSFPPAFMREVSLKIAAEWREPDLHATAALIASGDLSLDGLITHRVRATQAADAYRTAFNDASCLKMMLDWRELQ